MLDDKIDGEFYLDWDKHMLYGWEYSKSDLVVASIIKGIQSGDTFPPVPVQKINGISHIFYISSSATIAPGFADGGHHRAIAHYIENKPLRCILLPGFPEALDRPMIPIPEIILASDQGQLKRKKERDPSYRNP